MQTKNLLFILCVLLLLAGLMQVRGELSPTSVLFHGVGVNIDLTFPEEARPQNYISHNLTITAYNNINSLNITLFIYAPVNSTWQIIDPPRNIPWPYPLGINQSLPMAEIWFTLPQDANGILKCTLFVQTNQNPDYPSYTFYTTQVREMTYSQLLSDYNQLVADYYQLVADFDQLSSDYITLNDAYNNLQSSYAALNSSCNELSANYITLNNTCNDLQGRITSLQNSYNEESSKYKNADSARASLLLDISKLHSDYDSLNSTFYSVQGNYTFLQGNFTDLQAVYDELEETYNKSLSDLNDLQGEADIDHIVMFIFIVTVACLIAFIIYIKRKQPEPYVVIRKETVAMKPDEKT